MYTRWLEFCWAKCRSTWNLLKYAIILKIVVNNLDIMIIYFAYRKRCRNDGTSWRRITLYYKSDLTPRSHAIHPSVKRYSLPTPFLSVWLSRLPRTSSHTSSIYSIIFILRLFHTSTTYVKIIIQSISIILSHGILQLVLITISHQKIMHLVISCQFIHHCSNVKWNY